MSAAQPARSATLRGIDLSMRARASAGAGEGGAGGGGELAQEASSATAITAIEKSARRFAAYFRKTRLTFAIDEMEWIDAQNASKVSPAFGIERLRLALNNILQGIQIMGRGILLWLLGVPLPIILLLAMCSHH
jgi:hypothetical protein